MNRFERPDEDVICPLCNESATRADGEWGECGLCVNCGEFGCTHKPNIECKTTSFPWSAAQKRVDVLGAMEES